MNNIFMRVFLMLVIMIGDKEISVIINCPEDEKQLKGLEAVKARIVVRILSEKYGGRILEQYIENMEGRGEDYS